jgi:hypothetical protein
MLQQKNMEKLFKGKNRFIPIILPLRYGQDKI